MAEKASAAVKTQAQIKKRQASGSIKRECRSCQRKKGNFRPYLYSEYSQSIAPDERRYRPPHTTTCSFINPRFPHIFSSIQVRSRSPARIQAKLRIGAPGDSYEQEADRAADRVMAAPADVRSNSESARIQRVSRQPAGQPDTATASLDRVLASTGRPLEPALCRGMEGRFGHDFSRVRVHTGAEAEQFAREVNAHAFTVGRNVVFGSGQFSPGTLQGQRLIAHELAHVLQQEKGSIGLQRQPQDIDTILNEAKGTVEELEEVRKQLREGAENLEVVRWQLDLAGKKLPRASIKIVDKDIKSNVASLAEGLIETSKILYPYLTGKLVKTSVSRNFKIYDFREEFETKHDELAGIVLPSTGKAKPEKQDYGFFHRKSDSIHLAPDASFGHALHEAIHKYSAVTVQNALGVYFNEGATQYFTDLVLAEHTLGSASHSYGPNLKCANAVLDWINNDRTKFALAYFQGEANPLLQKVIEKLDIKLARELIKLREEGGGLGLCEKIKEKGS